MERRKKSALFLFIKDGKKAGLAAGTVKYYAQIHLQVWQNSVPSSIMRKFIYKSGRTQSAQGRETCP